MKVAPSIYSSQLDLLTTVDIISKTTADYIHVDCLKNVDEVVRDMKKLKDNCNLPIDMHLIHPSPKDILEELIAFRKKIGQIDMVVLPSSNDVHQDHQVIHQEGIRAFKHSRILGYELVWNNLSFTSNYHTKLSKKQLDAKWQAISEYKSQGFRNYKSQSFIEGLARVRGTQVGCEFAEAFELIRWID